MSSASFDLGGALDRYVYLLRGRGVEIGVIAPGDKDRVRQRHVDDSLRALDCIGAAAWDIADLGSGGGLPGIPLAIALPDRRFTLIEPRQRRAAFLELVVDELRLGNVTVMAARAEQADVTSDLCLARALAPLEKAWRLAERLLRPSGSLVYFAGSTWQEGQEAQKLGKYGISAEICSPKRFKTEGPLVIMRRSPAIDGSHDHGPTHL